MLKSIIVAALKPCTYIIRQEKLNSTNGKRYHGEVVLTCEISDEAASHCLNTQSALSDFPSIFLYFFFFQETCWSGDGMRGEFSFECCHRWQDRLRRLESGTNKQQKDLLAVLPVRQKSIRFPVTLDHDDEGIKPKQEKVSGASNLKAVTS